MKEKILGIFGLVLSWVARVPCIRPLLLLSLILGGLGILAVLPDYSAAFRLIALAFVVVLLYKIAWQKGVSKLFA